MKISHLTSITTRLNPFSGHSKTVRLLLALLPPNAHKSIQIKTTQLPRSSTLPAQLELAFKDGKVMKWEWKDLSDTSEDAKSIKQQQQEGRASLMDVVAEVERHTRKLGRKEELQG